MISVYRDRLHRNTYHRAVRIVDRQPHELLGYETVKISREQAAKLLREMRKSDDFDHRHHYSG